MYKKTSKVLPSGMSSATGSGWTFLSNHAHVLIFLLRNPSARLRDIGEAVGITERFAHSVVSDLVEAGYLTVSRSGRRNTYSVHANLNLRHPLEADFSVGELLQIFDTTEPRTTL
jgi:hypothetical protein